MRFPEVAHWRIITITSQHLQFQGSALVIVKKGLMYKSLFIFSPHGLIVYIACLLWPRVLALPRMIASDFGVFPKATQRESKWLHKLYFSELIFICSLEKKIIILVKVFWKKYLTKCWYIHKWRYIILVSYQIPKYYNTCLHDAEPEKNSRYLIENGQFSTKNQKNV